MSNFSNPNIWRRVGAVLVGLLGLWLVSTPVVALIEGLRERDAGRKLEFTNYLPILGTAWLVLFLFGFALLVGAGRLWRRRHHHNGT